MKIDRTGKSAAAVAVALAMALGGATTAAAEGEQQFEVGYKNGLYFEIPAAQAKIKIGGRIQGDWAAISADDELRAAFADDPSGVGAEFRRARLYVSGDLYDRIIFKAQYDFASGESRFGDVWVGMKKLGPVGTVKVGHFKEPFSLEELTSSKYITFMERSLPSVFDSSRNFGFMAQNHHKGGRINWALGIFADTDSQGFTFENDTKLNLSGRLTGLPYVDEEKGRLLHLGVSISRQFRDMTEVSYAQRPEVHLSEKFLNLDGALSNTDGNTLMAAELAWICGPFSLQGEFKPVWIDQPGGSTAFMHGAYATVSYFLTGESRPYNRSSASFSRVSPKNAFDPGAGKWGAWEIAARYSYLDLNDSGLNGGEEQNATFGVNWYLFSNVRLTANYVFGDVKDTGNSPDNLVANASGYLHAFQMRTQLEF